MKRYSGLHDKLCTIENIEVADDNARKNKNKKYGINKHDNIKLLNIVYIKYMNQKNVLFIDFLIIQIELLMIVLKNVLERRLKIKIF